MGGWAYEDGVELTSPVPGAYGQRLGQVLQCRFRKECLMPTDSTLSTMPSARSRRGEGTKMRFVPNVRWHDRFASSISQ